MTQPAPAQPAPAPAPVPGPAPTPQAPHPAPAPQPTHPATAHPTFAPGSAALNSTGRPEPALTAAQLQQLQQQGRPSDPGTGEDLPYFQEGVQWRNLPPEQQLAYWMHRSRKHEDRANSMRDYDELKAVKSQYEQLVTQTQTEHERAIAEARRQGETVAMGRANTMLVEAYIRSAAAARGVDNDAVTDFLETSRLDAFLVNGQVDTAKVYRQVARMSGAAAGQVAGVPAAPAAPAPVMPPAVPQPPHLGWPQQQATTTTGVPGQPVPQWSYGQQPVPAAPQWPGQIPGAPVMAQAPGQPPAAPSGPDFGQGVYQQAPPSGLAAGRAAARARYGDQNKTANSQA